MKNTRLKTKGFASAEQFLGAIDSIATLQTELRIHEARRDRLIQRVQERYRERIDATAAEIDHLLALAEAYADGHRAEVIPAGRQTGETALAVYGYRVHPPSLAPITKKTTWTSIVEAVKKAFPDRFVKTTEALRKDEIRAALLPEQLAMLGMRIIEKETFGVTPKLDDADTEKPQN